MREGCPTPTKIPFYTRKHAKAWRKHGSRKYTHALLHVRPYRCRCGFFHLGNLPEKAIRESREAAFGEH